MAGAEMMEGADETDGDDGHAQLLCKSEAAFFKNYLYNYTDVNVHVEGFDFKAGDFRDAIRDEVTAADGREEGMMIAHSGE